MTDFGIVIHGGAGAIARDKMTTDLENAFRAGLVESLKAGYEMLESDGTSLDAVEKAVMVMEDNPLFNAGRGAVYTHSERHEMDAAIMDGHSLLAGAVAGVHQIKNPVSLARLVMKQLPHVLLARDGAEEFARTLGVEMMPVEYFHTERRWHQLQEAKARDAQRGGDITLSEDSGGGNTLGTVGAVALDRAGNLAVATSTGGMSNSRFGRVGDSPIIGAGTYANNRTCAVSTTGHGEFFMRCLTAYDVSVSMEYCGLSLADASERAIFGRLAEMGGTGGLIAIDLHGNIALPFNTSGMYRGYYLQGGQLETAIYRD